MSTPLRTAIALVRAVVATTLLSSVPIVLAQGAVATPAPLADGSELVVTDRHGDHLLGYGRVEGGVLRLSLAEHEDDGLAVMVVDPAGRMSTLVGRFAADGLRVRVPGTGEDVTLASWLSDRGVRLTLDPARSSDDDRDDDREDGRGDEGDDEGDDDGDADADEDDRDDAPADGPSDDGAADTDDDGDDDGGDDRETADADGGGDANDANDADDADEGDDGADDDVEDDGAAADRDDDDAAAADDDDDA